MTIDSPVKTGGHGGKHSRVVLFVHGRDFKPSREKLLDLSVAAMSAGIERDCPELLAEFQALDKRMAYYGDLSNAWLSAAGKNYDETLDLSDRWQTLQALRAVQKRKHFSVSRYDRLPGKSALAEFAADLAAPLLGTIGLAGKVIGLFAGDVNEYWNSCDFNSQVRERVRSAICEALAQDSKLLLVSHGTGCIASYDVLWQLSHEPEYAGTFAGRKVEQWLTLGAPLGDSTVQKRLLGAQARGRERYPANIVAWHNVAAEDDYFCHDNTVGNDFKEMLKLRLVSSIRDYRIYNLAVSYGKSNPHSALGYLVHPRVAKIVGDWLRQDELVSRQTSTS